MTVTITTDNVFTLVASGDITMEEGQQWMLAENERITSAAVAKTAGKVHYGVTPGGAVNLRGVPGSAGAYGLTLFAATIDWLAENIDKVVAHRQRYVTEEFQRGGDGRLVRITSDKDESTASKQRCNAEIARWIIEAEDQIRLFGKDSVDDEWAAGRAEDRPDLGGVYPAKKLAKLVRSGDFSKGVTAALKVERKAQSEKRSLAEADATEEAAEEAAEAAE